MEDGALQPLFIYMCLHRTWKSIEKSLNVQSEQCVVLGAHVLERDMQTSGRGLTDSLAHSFHHNCSNGTPPHGKCTMHKEVEMAIVREWSRLRRCKGFSESVGSLEEARAAFAFSTEKLGLLIKEGERCQKKRNQVAADLIRKHFASALVKALEYGPDTLGPGDRLLCDYPSVHQLALCKDTLRVFNLAVQWLDYIEHDGGDVTECYRCHRKRPLGPKSGTGHVCGGCGCAWFCSMKCQVNDEMENIFAHAYACGYQQRRRRFQKLK